jgi:hypothetical protein
MATGRYIQLTRNVDMYEHPTVAIWTREFRDRLLLRGWSEKKAARFARVWGQRYLKRLQQRGG